MKFYQILFIFVFILMNSLAESTQDERANSLQKEEKKDNKFFDEQLQALEDKEKLMLKKIENKKRLTLEDIKNKRKHLLSEKEDFNRKLREGNLEKFRNTGECVECDLSELLLTPAIEELNKKGLKINLHCAILRRANMTGATIKNANFSEVDATGAFISNSIIFNTNFMNANIKGTDLHNADIRVTNFKNITFDISTNLTNTTINSCEFSDPKVEHGLKALRFLQNLIYKE